MKLSQIAILFVAIFFTIVIATDIRTDNLTVVADAKGDMDEYMDQALDSAEDVLTETSAETGEQSLDKGAAVDCFFSSMYASLGILSDPVAQEKFRAYVPVIAVTDMDGYYLMYNDEYVGYDGYTYISRRWTEMQPYVYEDADFIYRFTLGDSITILDKNRRLDPTGTNKVMTVNVKEIQSDAAYEALRTVIGTGSFLLSEENFHLVRQQAVVSCIEKDLSWYVSKHNDIASRFGITYQFALPVTETSDWAKAIEGQGLVVLFQGMPLKDSGGRVYNRMDFTGVGLRRQALYYVEQRGWYLVYHKEGCPNLAGNLNVRDEHYLTLQEVSELGCYADPVCDPMGVFAPSYSALSGDNTNQVYSIKNWDSAKVGTLFDVNHLSLSAAGGNLVAETTGSDSFFAFRYELADADTVDVVRVYAKITGNSTTTSQLFFTSEGVGMSEQKSVVTTIASDGQWQWIEFNVSGNPYWSGSLRDFRLDLIGNSTDGGRIEVNEIKMMGD